MSFRQSGDVNSVRREQMHPCHVQACRLSVELQREKPPAGEKRNIFERGPHWILTIFIRELSCNWNYAGPAWKSKKSPGMLESSLNIFKAKYQNSHNEP